MKQFKFEGFPRPSRAEELRLRLLMRSSHTHQGGRRTGRKRLVFYSCRNATIGSRRCGRAPRGEARPRQIATSRSATHAGRPIARRIAGRECPNSTDCREAALPGTPAGGPIIQPDRPRVPMRRRESSAQESPRTRTERPDGRPSSAACACTHRRGHGFRKNADRPQQGSKAHPAEEPGRCFARQTFQWRCCRPNLRFERRHGNDRGRRGATS